MAALVICFALIVIPILAAIHRPWISRAVDLAARTAECLNDSDPGFVVGGLQKAPYTVGLGFFLGSSCQGFSGN